MEISDERSGTASNWLQLWRGEISLGNAFWTYLVVYGVVLNVAFTLLALLVYLVFAQAFLALCIHFLGTPYMMFAGVGVWRSADKATEPAYLAFLAKLATLGLVGLSLFA